MNAWMSQQGAALASAWRRLWLAPLNTALSLLVIGIALTLPAFGYVVLDQLRDLGRNAASVQQISLFMTLEASSKDVAEIEKRLRQASTATWRFVPKEEALKRLQATEGMAEIVASLPRNPLPDAFIIEPVNIEPAALEVLKKELSTWPKVAHVQLDSAWVMRFDAFLRLGKLAVWMLAVLFGAGLVAVIFNIIRLQVMAQAAEIEVSRMIGATDGFIRRPFQYFGALQGALGGSLAAGLVFGALTLLQGPVDELAGLYGANFALQSPRPVAVLSLILLGGALGWLGAKLSVSLSLRKFE